MFEVVVVISHLSAEICQAKLSLRDCLIITTNSSSPICTVASISGTAITHRANIVIPLTYIDETVF